MVSDTTYISFYNSSWRIRIFKKTIRLLGSPKFFRFRIHEDGRSMLLEPFDRITLTSFRVPKNIDDEHGSLEIHSKPMTTILAKRMGWDMKRSYRIPGKVYQSQKVVVFDLTQASIITEDNSVNAFIRLNAEQQNGDTNE